MKNKILKLEQLIIDEAKEKIKVCAFTGHRTLEKDFSARKLKNEIKNIIDKGGERFLCGMAAGFDLAVAEAVISLRKKYPQIKLVACIPCPNQDKYFTETDKKRYAEILQKADEKILLSQNYYNGCMLARNRYMADRADVLIAYMKKDEGGTAYTVRYFTNKYPLKEIVFL